MTWLSTTAAQAEETANQARAAVAAYEAAFAMTVPPPVIEANRALLMALIATNFFGQNTPAIMATEALYVEMWAQDAAAMYGYAGASAAASQVTPFATPPQTTSQDGASQPSLRGRPSRRHAGRPSRQGGAKRRRGRAEPPPHRPQRPPRPRRPPPPRPRRPPPARRATPGSLVTWLQEFIQNTLANNPAGRLRTWPYQCQLHALRFTEQLAYFWVGAGRTPAGASASRRRSVPAVPRPVPVVRGIRRRSSPA